LNGPNFPSLKSHTIAVDELPILPGPYTR